MSLYFSMLREEDEFLGNTGFDSDMIDGPKTSENTELGDVAKAVEDINDEYAEESSQPELDAQDLTEDPVSECMISIYESEHNWNRIMQTIGLRELSEASKGREMVMEAADIKGFFKKIKEFFVRLFKKITAVVKNWIDNFSAKFRTNKSFLSKYGGKLDEGKKAYEDATKSKDFKGYNFTASSDKLIEDMKTAMTEMSQDTQLKFVKDLINTIRSAKAAGDFKSFKDTFKTDAIPDNVDLSEYRKDKKTKIFGSEEKDYLKDSVLQVEYLKKCLANYDKAIKGAKDAYSKTKTSFDKLITALNSLEKEVDKLETSEDKSKAVPLVTKVIDHTKNGKNQLYITYSTYLKAIHVQQRQARKVANAYIYALNRGTRDNKIEKAKAYNASYIDDGFLANVELV